MLLSQLDIRIERYIAVFGMIRPGETVLAAVSGGLDSMCLLHLLAGLRARLDFKLAAANYDHGLRGKQGEDERDLVQQACGVLDARFVGGRAGDLAARVQNGANLQAEARRLRYGFLWSAVEQTGAARLATGHHLDDQAETVLLRLTQGSGLLGLAGIRPVSQGHKLIRPLLELTRSELEKYARHNGIRWLDDPSNDSDTYRRNRLRHHLIPRIEHDYGPGFTANLASLATEAAEYAAMLDRESEGFFADGTMVIEDKFLRADCGRLKKLPAVIRRHLLRRAVERISGGKLLLSGRQLAAVDRLAIEGGSGQQIDLPAGLAAWREFDVLRVGPAPEQGTLEECVSIELGEGTGGVVADSGEWKLVFRVISSGDTQLEELLPAGGEQGAVALRQMFDLDKLNLPLQISRWRPGDRIRPFGLTGCKKVKKLFTERRIARHERHKVPLVRDVDGNILWVCGVARSETAPLIDGTARALVIEAARRADAHGLPQAVIDT